MTTDTPRRDNVAGGAVLKLSGLGKSFGDVSVLDGIDLDVRAGEVHALMGENGAGKSTLIKIVGGIHPPSRGRIRLGGQEHARLDPRSAQAAGVFIVHQEFSTVPDLSVAENLHMGIEPRRAGLLDWGAMRRRTRELAQQLGFAADPDDRVCDLSIAQRQLLEIGKALLHRASLVVFDEPTAALTQESAAQLLVRIDALRQAGVAIVYVSHRMEEVFRIADRISVLKDGRIVATQATAQLTESDVVRMMVGREVSNIFPPKSARRAGVALLQAEAVHLPPRLKPCSLALHAGEIVGVAGMAGSGRTTLAHCLFGALAPQGGAIAVDGTPLPPGRPAASMDRGLCYLTEDRRVAGLFLRHSVLRNATAATLPRHAPYRLLQSASERQAARSVIETLRIRARNEHIRVIDLSGGNQQKVLLGRLLERQPRILILDEPTRGVDVGAKAEIYRLMDELARRGTAILMISSELIEVVGMSDRVLVMREGEIVATLEGDAISERGIMEHAARDRGARDDAAPRAEPLEEVA